MKLEDKFRERLLGHLSDANTELDVKNAVDICKEEILSFTVFCAENANLIRTNKYWYFEEQKELTTDELLERYLNQE